MNSAEFPPQTTAKPASALEWTPLRHRLLSQVDGGEVLWDWPARSQRGYRGAAAVSLSGDEVAELFHLRDRGVIQHVRRPEDWRTDRVALTKAGVRLLAGWDARSDRSAGAA